MTGHPFDAARHVDQLPRRRVPVIGLFKILGTGKRLVEGDTQLHRHQLGDRIHLLVPHSQRPAGVAQRGAGRHRAKGDDLSDMVSAVAAHHIIDYLAAAHITEIDVKIRHAHPLGIQEPLEDQVVFDRIDTGDANAVGSEAARTRTPSGSHRNSLTFGIGHKIMNNQVVIDISHLFDDRKLIFQPLDHFGSRILTVVKAQTRIASRPEIFAVLPSVGSGEIGQLQLSEGKFEVAAARNLNGIVERLLKAGQRRRHLIAGLYIKFVGCELHARIVNRRVGLDAGQDMLHPVVRLGDIVAVVGRRQLHPQLARQAAQQRQNPPLLLDAMVLHLDIIILRPEDREIALGRLLRAGIIPRGKQPGNLPRKTGGKTDQPLRFLRKQLEIDPGLLIKTVDASPADQGNQILIAGHIFAEQHQMMRRGIDAVHPVPHRPGRDIDLASDDRLDADLLRLLIKIDHPVHHAMVGNGHGGLSEAFGIFQHPVDPAGAVEQAVFGMKMEMDKRFHGCSSPSRRRRAACAICRRRWLTPDRLSPA